MYATTDIFAEFQALTRDFEHWMIAEPDEVDPSKRSFSQTQSPQLNLCFFFQPIFGTVSGRSPKRNPNKVVNDTFPMHTFALLIE
jgi:hypothetical protein